jgi:hypothetical protein
MWRIRIRHYDFKLFGVAPAPLGDFSEPEMAKYLGGQVTGDFLAD